MWEITITLLAAVVGLWVIWRRKRFHILKDLGIPGPEPSFWFGNLWEMSSRPLECIDEWLEKYGDVMGYYFGSTPVVLIKDIEILRKIQVSDFQKFINRPKIFKGPSGKAGDGFTSQLANMNDRRWKEVRSLLTPSFTTKKLRMMAPIINGAIDSLMENIDEKANKGEWFDIYKIYQALTIDVIGRTAFGIQTDCQRNPNETLYRTMKALFSTESKSILFILQCSFPEFFYVLLPFFFLSMMFKNKGTNPLREMLSSLRNVIKTRRENTAHKRQDLLQLMIDAQAVDSDVHKVTAKDLTAGDDDQNELEGNAVADVSSQLESKLRRHMDDNEILDNAVMFLLAGHETTSSTLAFTTHFLVHYPEVQERVRDEVQSLVEKEGELDYYSVQRLQYLDQVIMESLRLYPPVYLFVSREVGEDVSYGNLHLKKGIMVQIPAYNLQRSEKYWTEPNKFDPERFSPENKARNEPFAFQAFGNGPRNCIGMRFAQMEAKLAIARILLKYRMEKCEQTDELVPVLKSTPIIVSPKKGVNVKAVLLSSSCDLNNEHHATKK